MFTDHTPGLQQHNGTGASTRLNPALDTRQIYPSDSEQ